MQWTTKQQKLEKLYNDSAELVYRERYIFPLLPVFINNKVIWLEKIKVKESLNRRNTVDFGDYYYTWEISSVIENEKGK